MTEMNSLSKLSYRELMQLKKNLNRKIAIRRRLFFICFSLCLILLIAFSVSKVSKAGSDKAETKFKYYKEVIIDDETTLWGLASENVDFDFYKDNNAYIKEVCYINNISDPNEIRVGDSMVIPYYSYTFIQ